MTSICVKCFQLLVIVFLLSHDVDARASQITGNDEGCTLPEYPEHGSYLVNNKVILPGSKVNTFTVLTYKCNENYKVMRSNSTYCLEDGIWNDEIKCFKMCDPLESLTVNFKCIFNGALIDCNKPIMSTSKVIASCKDYHNPIPFQSMILNCVNGSWDNILPSCTSECGLEVPIGTGLIIGGREEIQKHSPWNVGVYLKNNNLYELICGGNIISRNIIISTAECFSIGDVTKYAIAAGKQYKDWNNENDKINQQNTDVEKIYLPENYNGHKSFLQNDISVVIVKKPFDFSNYVLPICLDLLSMEFNNLQISPGVKGKVVGWGLTKEGDRTSSSNVLKRADISIISYSQCKDSFNEKSFLKYLTYEKLCAGAPDNGTTVCSGDSGSGLVVASTEKGQTRWYLRGLTSVGILDGTTRTTCAKDTYTLFTNVFDHANFVRSIIEQY